MTTTINEALFLWAAGLRTEFNAAYHSALETQRKWDQIATQINTTLPNQQYGWLGGFPVMEELRDEPREQGLTGYNYSLRDKTYKAVLSIERSAIEDDQYDVFSTMARNMAPIAVRHQNKLIYTSLPLGFTTPGYDGQNFFDTQHPDVSTGGVWSNRTSAPLSDAALEIAERSLMDVTDDKGEPMEAAPDTLVVGPALKRRAQDLIGSNIIVRDVGSGTAGTGATASTGYDNYFQGRYKLIVNPYLRGQYAFNWFLLDTSRELKPLLLQTRSDVPITTENDMEDMHAKIREIYNFSVRGRYVAGYGLPQLAYGSNATS